jgi:hypothetical protein
MIAAEEHRIDDLDLQLKGLVLVRAMLEVQGASPAELTAFRDEIKRVRGELADGERG